jgi:hypothetical protein
MSTSPRLSAASLVVSSGMTLKTRRLTLGELAPVLDRRPHHQLDAGREQKQICKGRCRSAPSLEALVADFLDVFLWHDPTGTDALP